jgi:bifunctional UDP-N-acetylglucosamine pyrophosphorylase / glucosamine-1-phosphate N-acetyltransferase
MKKNQIDDPIDLLRLKKNKMLLYAENLIREGVGIADPERIDIHGSLICGENVNIDINVIIKGNVKLGNNVTIGANSIISDSTIGNNSIIKPFSLIESARIGKNSFVGPYGRIREGTVINDFVQIGNFVEVKNATIMNECRINHLSFIGDADLAENVTMGAGSITCNHNGIESSKTIINHDAYIGSGVNLIAPLTIGSGSTIGAGSTINQDVPKGKLVIARSKQVEVNNWSRTKESK